MSYSPQNAGFFDTIQLYFLEVTGRGIMFSGRDMELLCRWRDQGASAAVICRGIQEAVRSMAEGETPRGISSCQGCVEQEIARVRERSAGGRQPADEAAPNPMPDAPPASAQPACEKVAEEAPKTDGSQAQHPHRALLEGVLETIERAGQACEEDQLRKVYRDAWRATRELLRADELADPFSELAGIEDALADGYFRALDQHKQAQIAEAIAAENRAGLALMSPEARREHLAARRRSLLVREHGLTRLIE